MINWILNVVMLIVWKAMNIWLRLQWNISTVFWRNIVLVLSNNQDFYVTDKPPPRNFCNNLLWIQLTLSLPLHRYASIEWSLNISLICKCLRPINDFLSTKCTFRKKFNVNIQMSGANHLLGLILTINSYFYEIRLPFCCR